MAQLRNIEKFFLSMARSKDIDRRFWNLLRTDLMGLKPGRLEEYFKTQTRLKELNNFGNKLISEFETLFNENRSDSLREFQEELVTACLEMDAHCKFKKLEKNSLPSCSKDALGRQLGIWRAS